jgi:transposase/ribosomal protein S24E
MVKLFNVKRSLTSKEKLNALFATFGSLSDFTCK